MNNRQRKRHERGQRADVYMDSAAQDFPAGSKGAELAARLKELLAQVAALLLSRAASAGKRRQGTEGRAEARAALRRMVKTTWDTYKTITRARPDIKGLFEPPSKSNNDQALATTVRAYAAAAPPLAGLFADYGLTAAFFNDMRAQADTLESRVALQNQGAGAGVDTTAAIEETLGQMDEVVESLDTVVTNKYRDDPAKLAAWESASRVERAPRPKPEEDAAPTTPPANG